MEKNPLRGPDLRKQNKLVVLRYIYSSKRTSQSEVVTATGLKPATIYRIFSQLEEENLIKVDSNQSDHEAGSQTVRGRRPLQYSLVAEARYAAGVDLTPRYFVLVVVDFAGNVIFENRVDFPVNVDAECLVREVSREYLEAIRKKRIRKDKILGLGIGIPGRVDTVAGISLGYPRIPDMTDFPVAGRISEKIKVPVYVHNNCSIITMSAYHYGTDVTTPGSLMMLLLRFGIGGGFYSDGRNIEFGDKTIMEIGHMPIDLEGSLCSCGSRGCLDTYLGEDVIINDLKKVVSISSIKDIDSAMLGDANVKKILEGKGRILYKAVRTLFQTFFPDNILLVSRNSLLSQFYVNVIKSELAKDRVGPPPYLYASNYDPYTYGRGACDLVWNNYFKFKREDD